jgi:hypothetical protein
MDEKIEAGHYQSAISAWIITARLAAFSLRRFAAAECQYKTPASPLSPTTVIVHL